MRANWISHGVSAGGTGALTLTRDGSYPMLTDVFGTSGTLIVEYEADDGSKFESGIGSLALSTNVLTRSTVRETFDSAGPTYNAANPTALSLAGSAKVRVTPLANSFVPTVHAANSTDCDNGVFAAGNMVDGAFTTFTFATSTIYYVPFLWNRTFPIGKAGVYVNTTQAAQTCRAALYRLGTDGRPDQLVADFDTFSTASNVMVTKSAASFASPTSAFYLPAGWYMAAFAASAAAGLAGATVMIPGPLGNKFDRNGRYISRGSFSYGAFNASASSNGSGSYTLVANAVAPALYLGP